MEQAQAIAAVGLLLIALVFALYIYIFNPRPFEGFADRQTNADDEPKTKEKRNPRVE